MSDTFANPVISPEVRAAMMLQSERQPTLEERANPSGVPVEARPEPNVVEFEEVQEDDVQEELERNIDGPTSPHLNLCTTVAEANQSSVLDLALTTQVEVVVGVYEDNIQAILDGNAVSETNGRTYNLIQPLGAYNKKSEREGVLYSVIPRVMQCITEAELESCRIIMERSTATVAVQDIVNHQLNRVNAAIYSQFPAHETEDGELIPYVVLADVTVDDIATCSYLHVVSSEGEDPVIGLDVRTLISHEAIVKYHDSILRSDDAYRQLVEIVHILHLRVPIFLRTTSTRIESTLRSYVNNLKARAEEVALPIQVYLAVPNHSLFSEPTWNLMQLVRENCPDASPVTYAQFAEQLATETDSAASTYTGHHSDDVAAAMFKEGDFIIPLNLVEPETDGDE